MVTKGTYKQARADKNLLHNISQLRRVCFRRVFIELAEYIYHFIRIRIGNLSQRFNYHIVDGVLAISYSVYKHCYGIWNPKFIDNNEIFWKPYNCFRKWRCKYVPFRHSAFFVDILEAAYVAEVRTLCNITIKPQVFQFSFCSS